MIGQQLGHYKIVSQLGRGGMASVFKAEQIGLGRPVAIKILQPALAADEVIVQRFQQEARIAANLHHNHVVTIYDVGEVDGTYYIAMRYIEGENLGQLLRREGPLEPERALKMIEQVAEALDFAHSRGVLHRDVKPANVMVEPGDILTLTDFGIARAGEQSHLTATRMIIGTPEYMSPEQARGDVVDKRADLYALGVLMYEALGGRPPFSAASTPSLLYLHVHEPPPPLSQLRPDLPQALSDVLSKALAKTPGDRFQSGREMIAAARAAIAGGMTSPNGPRTAAQTQATMVQPGLLDPGQEAPTPPPVSRPVGGVRPTPAPVQPTPPPVQPVRPTPPSIPPVRPTPPPANGPQMQPAARVGATRTMTPPPVPPAVPPTVHQNQYQPFPTPAPAPIPPRKSSNTWVLGPVLVALALVIVGAVIFLGPAFWKGFTDGLERSRATPTAVAAKPTVAATPEPTVQQATGPTAAPKPTEAAAAKPTEPPAKPTEPPAKPTAPPAKPTVPPTPSAPQRVEAAQAAVTAGDFPTAIDQLKSLREDPSIKADPSLSSQVNEILRKTYVVYGDQMLSQNRLDDAYGLYTEALKIAPNDPEALDGQKRVVLTKNYFRMEAAWGKDDEEAISALEENMTLDPSFRDTRQKLYSLLIAKADRLIGGGNRDGAFPVLMRALEVVPDGPEAKQRLASYTPTPRPTPPPPPPQQQQRPPQQQQQPPSYTPPQQERNFTPPGSPV